MAIDSRIALALNPLNVGERVAQNVQNLQQIDLLNQRRQQAPFQNALLQLQTELAQAQQPAQLQAAERAASPTAQAQQALTQKQQLGVQIAQTIKPMLDSGNTLGAIAELSRLNGQNPNLGLSDDIKELQADPAQYKKQVDSVLQLSGVAQRGGFQFGAQETFKDSQGNVFLGTQRKDPSSGEVATVFSPASGNQELQPQGQLRLVSGLGQTAQEKAAQKVETEQELSKIKASAEGKSAAIKAGVSQATKAFEKIPLIRTAIGNYNEAISALDAGAETGTVDQFLPSLTRASKELDNVIKRLGLDVVGNTTFGALSESELAFALKAAIPDNLQPAELKQWLTAKRNAQQKILSGLEEMTTFLGDGTKTLADWKNQQALKALSGEADTFTPPASPAAQEAQPVDLSSMTVEQLIAERERLVGGQ